MAASEYKGVLVRIFSTNGLDADVDLLWSQQQGSARSEEETAINVLMWVLNAERGDLLDRIKTGVPPLTPDEAAQIRFTLNDIERTARMEITALNTAGGNALASSITTTATFVPAGFGPDPNDPTLYGVPPWMVRS